MRIVQIILRIMSNKNAILTVFMESTLYSSLGNYYQIKKQTKCKVNASLYLLERTIQQVIYLFIISVMFRFKKAAERSLCLQHVDTLLDKYIFNSNYCLTQS